MSKASLSIEDLLSEESKRKVAGNTGTQRSSSNGQLEEEKKPGEKLQSKLKTIKEGETEDAVKARAAAVGLFYVDLAEFPVSDDALKTVAQKVSIENKVICFLNTGEEIRLATTDPENPELEKISHGLEEAFHAKIKLYLISARNLQKQLARYDKIPKYRKAVQGVAVKEEELEKFSKIAQDLKSLEAEIKKVNITEMVAFMVAAAIQARATDIHVEAEEKDIKVRFRIDGVLHDAATIEKDKWSKIIARIKLVAGVKMNISNRPQDGRFAIILKDEKIDVRTSVVPTSWGESVVMRLLRSKDIALSFEKLGVVGRAEKELQTQIKRPNGMIVTTGPTGSGKTTTLYAILKRLNVEGTKVITLEDPVEYKLEGINQSQIDHSKDYSFVTGLKSILRQDPDVIMVGEMRDLETADTAINAALTGHLLLSTIHTNSAAGAIPRFLALGVKPFLLAPALNAIMGQRLVRRVCEKCKEEVELEAKDLERVKNILEAIAEDHPDRPDLSKMKFFKGKGCESCNGLGYKGRIGIYEIMIMTKEIEKIILSGKVSEYDMQEIAVKAGMITMVQDGLMKAGQGMTTVEEVFRVSE